RDLVGEGFPQSWVGVDVDPRPVVTGLGDDLGDGPLGRLAQMTAGARIHDHAGVLGVRNRHASSARASARSRPLATFPVGECGRAATTRIRDGTLNRASLCSATSRTAASITAESASGSSGT